MAQKGTFLDRVLEKFVEEVVRNPSSTSASIFTRAGVTPKSRQAGSNVLNEIAPNIKHNLSIPLRQIHNEKRLT